VRLRLSIVGLVVTALFGALGARLWYLEVLQAPRSVGAVVANAVRKVRIPAPRGLIEARGGQVLAGDKTVLAVTLSKQVAATDPAVVGRVAQLLGLSTKTVQADLNDTQFSPYQPVPLKVGVSLPTVIRLREHQSSYPGVSVELDTERTYPYGATASHLLGYVGQISASELKALASQGYSQGAIVGQSGVEASFQKYLRGRAGVERLEVNAANQVVGSLGETPPRPGDTVVLGLDLSLQKKVDAYLSAEIHTLRRTLPALGGESPAPGGAAVVLNPQDGRVLAMASYPTYDPEIWVGGISQANYDAITSPSAGYPLLNRAIAGLYTPGSTFKLATASAALQTGLITPSTTIDDANGTFVIPGCSALVTKCVFHDAPGTQLGQINVVEAIAESDDVFFYTLGYRFWEDWINNHRFGETPIQDWAHKWGLGVPTGIDLPGAVTGFIDSPALRQELHRLYPKAYPYPGYYVGDNIEMAFGQGMTEITPIELAQAYATFANGGTRYAPQVAEAILSPSGRLLERFQPKVLGHVTLSPANRAAMLQGYEQEVTNPYGTGYYTFLHYPYAKLPIAGKTGTASHRNAAGQRIQPTSLYVGFGPVAHPRYVVAVVIERGGYGDSGAGVVARNIFEYLIRHPVPAFHLPTAQSAAGASTRSAPSGGSTAPVAHGSTGSTSTGSTSTGSTTALLLGGRPGWWDTGVGMAPLGPGRFRARGSRLVVNWPRVDRLRVDRPQVDLLLVDGLLVDRPRRTTAMFGRASASSKPAIRGDAAGWAVLGPPRAGPAV
jgi:penicillin-binding protein 2